MLLGGKLSPSLDQEYCGSGLVSTPESLLPGRVESEREGIKQASELSTMLRKHRVQSRLTLYDPMVCSPPGSSVHGILLAKMLEWVAMPSSRGSSPPRDQTRVS